MKDDMKDDEPMNAPAVKCVQMKRDKKKYPDGPWTAEVHPDEVGNFAMGGWVKA